MRKAICSLGLVVGGGLVVILLGVQQRLTLKEEGVRNLDNIVFQLACNFDGIQQLLVLHVAVLLEVRSEIFDHVALHFGTASTHGYCEFSPIKRTISRSLLFSEYSLLQFIYVVWVVPAQATRDTPLLWPRPPLLGDHLVCSLLNYMWSPSKALSQCWHRSL